MDSGDDGAVEWVKGNRKMSEAKVIIIGSLLYTLSNCTQYSVSNWSHVEPKMAYSRECVCAIQCIC